MIFLRTPITIYNTSTFEFQENSQYSSCHEQRLQATSDRWANPSAFGGHIFFGLELQAGTATLVPQQPRMRLREQDRNVHRRNGNRNRASPTCLTSAAWSAQQERKQNGNTVREVWALDSTVQAGCCAPFWLLFCQGLAERDLFFHLPNFRLSEKNPNQTVPRPADHPAPSTPAVQWSL